MPAVDMFFWAYLGFAGICMLVGMASRTPAWRLMAPLGLIWAVGAASHFFVDGPIAVGIWVPVATVVVASGCFWLAVRMKEFRASSAKDRR